MTFGLRDNARVNVPKADTHPVYAVAAAPIAMVLMNSRLFVCMFISCNRSGPWGLIFQFGHSIQPATKQQLTINGPTSHAVVKEFLKIFLSVGTPFEILHNKSDDSAYHHR